MWAFFYPGQGSQSPGMGRWIYDEFTSVKRIYEEANDALKLDLKKICFDGPEEELQKTEITQPAILATSIAYQKVLNEVAPINPISAAGHSIGEYAALVAANVIPFDKAIIAVRERGLAMQSAVPIGIGGMCAVLNLDENENAELCKWATKESGLGVVEPANFNTPGQIVISGIQKTIDWLIEHWNQYQGPGAGKKARWIPLKVSAPFHCSLMKPAEEKMSSVLNSIPFENASYPIMQNYSATEATDASVIKQNLIRQISGTVRWSESVQKIVMKGVKKGIELGHGQVVRGLNKKISADLEMLNLQNLDDLKIIERLIQKPH